MIDRGELATSRSAAAGRGFDLDTRKTGILVTAIVMLTMSFSPASADVSGMLNMCTGCHGEDGRGGTSDTPIIAGIPAVIQEDALYAYADGARDCGAQPLMCKIASRLDEQQTVELAAHFANMSYSPAAEDFDAALAAKGKTIHQESCAICHGDDDPGDAESGILHGQRVAYLRNVMQQYTAGEREQLPAMQKNMSQLSTDDIEALANYYASYRE